MEIHVVQPSVMPRERYVLVVNGQEIASGAQRSDLKAGVSRVDLKDDSGTLLAAVEDRSGLFSPQLALLFPNGAEFEYAWSDRWRATWALRRRGAVVLVQQNHGAIQTLWEGDTQVGRLEHLKKGRSGPDHYFLHASNAQSALLLGALVVAYDFYTTTGGKALGGFLPSRRSLDAKWSPSALGAPNLAAPRT